MNVFQIQKKTIDTEIYLNDVKNEWIQDIINNKRE